MRLEGDCASSGERVNVACRRSTHCECDVTDVALQIVGESGAAQAERSAGDEQEHCLHGLHDGAAELHRQVGARPVEII